MLITGRVNKAAAQGKISHPHSSLSGRTGIASQQKRTQGGDAGDMRHQVADAPPSTHLRERRPRAREAAERASDAASVREGQRGGERKRERAEKEERQAEKMQNRK